MITIDWGYKRYESGKGELATFKKTNLASPVAVKSALSYGKKWCSSPING